MTDITCSICLEPLKTPVSTPCGHLHCEDCLTELVASGPESVEAACPTCRAPFSIVQPDLRFVPQKYHKFIVPSIRRVYFESTSQESRNLRTEIETLQERVRGLSRDKTLLMDRCEAAMAASSTHSLRERSARQENQRLERSNGELKKQFEEMRQKYEALKGKYRELKSAKVPMISPPHLASKRSRTQAALDGSSTNSSCSLRASDYEDDCPGSDGPLGRLILPVPKRPRIHSGFPLPSPAPDGPPPPVFKKSIKSNKTLTEEFMEIQQQKARKLSSTGGPSRAGPSSSRMQQDPPMRLASPVEIRKKPSRPSVRPTELPLSSSVSSNASEKPQHSGLLQPDLFSPRRAADENDESGQGSLIYDSEDFKPFWLNDGLSGATLNRGMKDDWLWAADPEEEEDTRERSWVFKGTRWPRPEEA